MGDSQHPAGLFADCTPTEKVVAIVPSPRVSAGQFVGTLQQNGVNIRVLGHGSSWVMDKNKIEVCVPGTLFAAVQDYKVGLAKQCAQLCGVTVTVLQIQQ